ncbi:MAG: aldo/keto reductase [Planctomycetes bacterium]|nr:aldo/keto reductase [Planctomycetota bacterium]
MVASLSQPVALGRTGLTVSRLAVGASYGVPQGALESAFDRGLTFFYWGSLRTRAMAEAIRAIARRGQRERLVVALQSFVPAPAGLLGSPVSMASAAALRLSVHAGLRRAGLDRAEVLILGWKNAPLSPWVCEAAARLRDEGKVRSLAVSCHHRPTFRAYIEDGFFDAIMVRYNAAHRGAEGEVFPLLPPRDGPGVMAYTATRWGGLCDPRLTAPGERTPRGRDCYRFCLSHPAVHLCMTGPADEAEMDEALTALEAAPMDEEELAWMRRVGDHLHGRRHLGVRVE